jgi:hypothetical protein
MNFLTDRPIHTSVSLGILREVALRRMTQQIEFQMPGDVSRGFGEADSGPIISARTRCAIAAFNSGIETETEEGPVFARMQYEIVVPAEIEVTENARGAVPAFFPMWKPNTTYALKSIVSLPNQTNGSGPYFECVLAGTSGAAIFQAPLSVGALATDNEVKWRLAGYSTLYEVQTVNRAESNAVETFVICRKVD